MGPQWTLLVGAVIIGIACGVLAVLLGEAGVAVGFFILVVAGLCWDGISEEVFGRVNNNDEGTYGVLPMLVAAIAAGFATYSLRRASGRDGWGEGGWSVGLNGGDGHDGGNGNGGNGNGNGNGE